MLSSYLSNPHQVHRRDQLRRLDAILSDLEALNLKDADSVPHSLQDRLRHAGVGYPDGANVSELIDMVFRAQEPYLQPLAIPVTRRRRAA